ncbi:MAG: TlpA family protein disulfide reductase [Fimbriimonadaceae bacterium]
MKRIILPLLMAFAATAAFAQEEKKPLTIGDPAPAFKSDGHIKGQKITELKKGQTYVVEFWATWCGPCIAVFPHLSELTRKYADQITTVSINTWDYPKGQNESKDDHTKRVQEFVEKQGDKMAYNIILDDDKDTMSTTWMRAAGQNGIPCAFIINEEGIIAWIGHPATMDKPLEQIVAKTWDIQAFKTKFDEQAAKAKEAAALSAEVVKISKAGDMEAFDAIVKKIGVEAIYAVMNGDHNFAIKAIEKYAGKLEEFDHTTVCSMTAYLVGQKDTTEENKATALKMSEMCFGQVKEEEAALAAAYHARALFAAGKKDEAKAWIKKASDLVAKYMPEQQRPGIQKFIDDTAKSFDVSN